MGTRCGNVEEYKVQYSRPRVQLAIRVIILVEIKLSSDLGQLDLT